MPENQPPAEDQNDQEYPAGWVDPNLGIFVVKMVKTGRMAFRQKKVNAIGEPSNNSRSTWISYASHKHEFLVDAPFSEVMALWIAEPTEEETP